MNIKEKSLENVSTLIDRYLNGKDISSSVRRIIDPILSINIASYLFERIYYQYQWIDITDYKSIISFVVKGQYIIPLSLFIVVHLAFLFVSTSIFHFISEKASAFIKKIKMSKEEKIEFYKKTRSEPHNKLLNSMLKGLTKISTDVERSLYFLFKVLVVLCFYYCILPEYNTILFLLLFLFFVILLAVVLLLHLACELIPPIFALLKKEADEFFANIPPFSEPSREVS